MTGAVTCSVATTVPSVLFKGIALLDNKVVLAANSAALPMHACSYAGAAVSNCVNTAMAPTAVTSPVSVAVAS